MVSRSSRTEPTSQAKRCVHRVRGEFAAFVRFFPRKQDANLRGHTHTHIQAHTHSQIVAYNAPITAVAPALHARQYLACSGHRWVNLKACTWRVYFDFPEGRRDLCTVPDKNWETPRQAEENVEACAAEGRPTQIDKKKKEVI